MFFKGYILHCTKMTLKKTRIGQFRLLLNLTKPEKYYMISIQMLYITHDRQVCHFCTKTSNNKIRIYILFVFLTWKKILVGTLLYHVTFSFKVLHENLGYLDIL